MFDHDFSHNKSMIDRRCFLVEDVIRMQKQILEKNQFTLINTIKIYHLKKTEYVYFTF